MRAPPGWPPMPSCLGGRSSREAGPTTRARWRATRPRECRIRSRRAQVGRATAKPTPPAAGNPIENLAAVRAPRVSRDVSRRPRTVPSPQSVAAPKESRTGMTWGPNLAEGSGNATKVSADQLGAAREQRGSVPGAPGPTRDEKGRRSPTARRRPRRTETHPVPAP